MRPINVISLFEGMGAGITALKDLGVKIGKYYSSEIDKFAVEQVYYMFPEAIQLGDVTNWREWDIDWSSIDLIFGGFPCQAFSAAGKQGGFEDVRGMLFFTFIDIINHARKFNPKVKFIGENVASMKKEFQHVINQHVGIFPVMIDAVLVSAQVRKRLFWSNIRTRTEGLFGEIHTDIPQPEDRNIYLKDILEDKVDEKYYLSAEMHEKLITQKLINEIEKLKLKDSFGFLINKGEARTVLKSSCLDASYYKGLDNHAARTGICVSMRGRNIVDGKRKDYFGAPTEQRLEPNENGKTNCLTSVSKDNLILVHARLGRSEKAKKERSENLKKGKDYCKFNDRVITEIDEEKMSTLLASPNPNKDNLILGFDIRTDEGIRIRQCGKSGTLTAMARTDESCGHNVIENYRLRRLTPLECLRLQSFPEWYNFKETISESQQYKMIGNSWNVEIFKHILSFFRLD